MIISSNFAYAWHMPIVACDQVESREKLTRVRNHIKFVILMGWGGNFSNQGQLSNPGSTF